MLRCFPADQRLGAAKIRQRGVARRRRRLFRRRSHGALAQRDSARGHRIACHPSGACVARSDARDLPRTFLSSCARARCCTTPSASCSSRQTLLRSLLPRLSLRQRPSWRRQPGPLVGRARSLVGAALARTTPSCRPPPLAAAQRCWQPCTQLLLFQSRLLRQTTRRSLRSWSRRSTLRQTSLLLRRPQLLLLLLLCQRLLRRRLCPPLSRCRCRHCQPAALARWLPAWQRSACAASATTCLLLRT
jgi:hypothetical protein